MTFFDLYKKIYEEKKVLLVKITPHKRIDNAYCFCRKEHTEKLSCCCKCIYVGEGVASLYGRTLAEIEENDFEIIEEITEEESIKEKRS